MTRNINVVFGLVLAASFYGDAFAQTPGTVSLNAFVVGNGPNVQGFKSLVCTGFAVGTGAGAAPTCRVIASADIPSSVALTGTPTAPTAVVDTNTTQLATTAFVLAQAAAATPIVDGTGAAGTSTRYARADHVHPTDTSRAAIASPTFTGTPAGPTATADTNTTQIATTAYVLGQASGAFPLMDGTAAVGTSVRYARGDHVHPTDTTRAPLASPTFTGTPAAPTAVAGTNTNQIATTQFVASAVVASTTGVASIAGNTGAFTLSKGITNSVNDIRLALNNATVQASVASPTSTTSTTGVLMGLGSVCALTPVYSTRVNLTISGHMTAGGGAVIGEVAIRYGTGAAPSNGDALSGTQVGSYQFNLLGASGATSAYSRTVNITGLTAGTVYWFDVALISNNGSAVSIANNDCAAFEF